MMGILYNIKLPIAYYMLYVEVEMDENWVCTELIPVDYKDTP